MPSDLSLDNLRIHETAQFPRRPTPAAILLPPPTPTPIIPHPVAVLPVAGFPITMPTAVVKSTTTRSSSSPSKGPVFQTKAEVWITEKSAPPSKTPSSKTSTVKAPSVKAASVKAASVHDWIPPPPPPQSLHKAPFIVNVSLTPMTGKNKGMELARATAVVRPASQIGSVGPARAASVAATSKTESQAVSKPASPSGGEAEETAKEEAGKEDEKEDVVVFEEIYTKDSYTRKMTFPLKKGESIKFGAKGMPKGSGFYIGS